MDIPKEQTEVKNETFEEISVISYEDFVKGDLRTGTVMKCERVPKSKKLLQMEVSFGDLGTRTILAGLGEQFTPEDMMGKSIVSIVNLPPRTMMGLVSHGMILAGKDKDGKLFLVGANGAADGVRLG